MKFHLNLFSINKAKAISAKLLELYLKETGRNGKKRDETGKNLKEREEIERNGRKGKKWEVSKKYPESIQKLSQKYPKSIPKVSKKYPKGIPQIF